MAATNNQPLVSIYMPVYNAQDYVEEAIKSIIDQTYQNWEMVIFNDGSTDTSLSIIEWMAAKDKRIRVINSHRNLGLAGMNKAVAQCRGQFVAKMDADDLSINTRIEKQVEFLKNNPQVVAVGGQCKVIDQNGKMIGVKRFPTDPKETKKMMWTNMPIQHPSVMFNRSLLPKDFGWYENNGELVIDDVHFFFGLFQYGDIANLDRFVLKYRMHGANMSFKYPKKTFFLTLRARIAAIRRYRMYPSFKAVMINLVQLGVMLVLPSKAVLRLYYRMKKIKPTFSKSNSYFLKRA